MHSTFRGFGCETSPFVVLFIGAFLNRMFGVEVCTIKIWTLDGLMKVNTREKLAAQSHTHKLLPYFGPILGPFGLEIS